VQSAAFAVDTCWDHNGSLMRLQSDGARRVFLYEDPRPGLRAIGVRHGTLLFDGRRTGEGYAGTARVFLRGCGGEPVEYAVRGVVSADQTRVTMTGVRPVFDGCRATGAQTEDVLVFTYVRQCEFAAGSEPEVIGDRDMPPTPAPAPGPRRAR
jgi:hypothetical protein